MEAEAERLCAGYEDLAFAFVESEDRNPTEEQGNGRFVKIFDFITKGACREIADVINFKMLLEEASFKFVYAARLKRKGERRIGKHSIRVAECTVRMMSESVLSNAAALRYFVEDNPENDPEKLDIDALIDQLRSFDERYDALCRVGKKLGCYIVYQNNFQETPSWKAEDGVSHWAVRRVVISPSGSIISQEKVADDKISTLTPARTVIANDAFAKYMVEQDLGMFDELKFYNGYEPKKEGDQNG